MEQNTQKRTRKVRHNMNFQSEVLSSLKNYADDQGLSVCSAGNSIIRQFLISNGYIKSNK